MCGAFIMFIVTQKYVLTRAVFGFGGSRVWQFSGMAVVVMIDIMVLSKTVLNVTIAHTLT